MRFLILVFVVLSLVSAIIASSASSKKQAPACSRACGEKYEPICAKAKKGNKLLTFGNDCVLGRFNCEHPDEQYDFESKGECGGNVSVRLS
ncbi:uncharacterized protein LOC118747699 isoform X2 [Rhagoletis pomonella]|uniref:uncharacterized protein LOC118747699 isoform X2 n=1 Tax=Rhagoletis pomonella TaxID=28610 RepID=UPI001786215C|nr:uncharacterized protein LOC118747699 isoform X2 [Rhagoletis pomonella]